MARKQSHSATRSDQNLDIVFGTDDRQQTRRKRFILIGAGLAILVATLIVWLWPDDEAYTYKTAPIKQGDLTVLVTATGSLEPVNEVEVGTEVSGTVASVHVDFNDQVRAGQVLARLNTDLISAQVAQSRSALRSARAGLSEAEATVEQTAEELKKLEHLYEISDGKMPARQEILAARAAAQRALAAKETALARIAEAQATLGANEISLSKTVIRSPINGIVLNRQVEPGQTVAASLQTPILFLLAENLTEMHLTVDVDEADIGRVKPGQSARFSVEAFPDEYFDARIKQVRYAPETVEGVVTYETVLSVDNRHLRLRPGMTATAEIVVGRAQNVRLIPNAAFRFAPPASANADESTGERKGLLGLFFPPRSRNERADQNAENNAGSKPGEAQVWVLKDNQPVAVTVQIGSTDGEWTVVQSGLETNTAVIVDVQENER